MNSVMNNYLTLVGCALDEGVGRLRLILTVRSEFEPQFAQSPLKDRWPQARFLVPPMTQDELRRVIEGPAAVKVIRFEPVALVDDLVNEVVQMPGALPLLSFALSQMYTNYLRRRSDDRALTDADYRALEGGVTGSLRVRANELVGVWDELHESTARRVVERLLSAEAGCGLLLDGLEVKDPVEDARVARVLSRMEGAGLVLTSDENGQFLLELAQGATSQSLNDLVARVKQAFDLYQETARRVLERFVSVDLGEFARRRVVRDEFEVADPAEQARVDKILERLIEARLVVTDEIEDRAYLELAHDALILGWDRLLAWVRHDAILITDLRRLTPDAEIWVKSPKRQAGRLWADLARLDSVQKLLANASPGLNKIEAAFVGASVQRARRNRIVRNVTMLALALLAAGASWFAYSTEQQRIRSESNRLALAAQLSSQVDQSLLLAVASSRLETSFEAKAALLSGLTKRPYLRRLMHGANGAIGETFVLPNNNIVTRSNANSGQLIYWPTKSSNNYSRRIQGVADGFDEFVITSDNDKAVVRRKEQIEIYEFTAPFDEAILTSTVNITDTYNLTRGLQRDLVYVTTSTGDLVTIDASKRELISTDRLPVSDATESHLAVGNGEALAFQSKDGVWLRLNGTWQQLTGAASSGYTFVGLAIDSENGLIISALGVEQNRELTDALEKGRPGFQCWILATGALSRNCPELEPLAHPAVIGRIGAKIAFYSNRDLRTRYDRTEYRIKEGNIWTRDILRIDPTFVSSLTVDDRNQTLLVGTVDGEMGEYSLDSFISGSAYEIPEGLKPLLTNWTDGVCHVLVSSKARLELRLCNGGIHGSAARYVELDGALSVQPELTSDLTCVFAIDANQNLIVWDGNLNEVARVSSSPEHHITIGAKIAVDHLHRHIIVVFEESDEIWLYDISLARWRLLAIAPFRIRSITISENDASIFAGSATNGGVAGFDAVSGHENFTASIPSGEHVWWIVPSKQSLYLSTMTGRHSLYRVNIDTGEITSGDLNRFSGPEKVISVSVDGRYFVVEGVGLPNGKVAKSEAKPSGLTIEFWDAVRLLPLGDGVHLNNFEWSTAAFSPDNSKLSLVFSSPLRAVNVPMDAGNWIIAACRMAGRELEDVERARFGIHFALDCKAPR